MTFQSPMSAQEMVQLELGSFEVDQYQFSGKFEQK
jgi:hypothetical protein